MCKELSATIGSVSLDDIDSLGFKTEQVTQEMLEDIVLYFWDSDSSNEMLREAILAIMDEYNVEKQ